MHFQDDCYAFPLQKRLYLYFRNGYLYETFWKCSSRDDITPYTFSHKYTFYIRKYLYINFFFQHPHIRKFLFFWSVCHGISSLVMNPLPPTAPHDLCALGARLRATQQLHENSRFQFPGPVHYHHAYTDMWPTTAVNLHHLRLGPWKLYKCSCENCNRSGIHPLLLFKYLRYPVCAPDGWRMGCGNSEWNELMRYCRRNFHPYDTCDIVTEHFEDSITGSQYLVWLPCQIGFPEHPLPPPTPSPVISLEDLTACISEEMQFSA